MHFHQTARKVSAFRTAPPTGKWRQESATDLRSLINTTRSRSSRWQMATRLRQDSHSLKNQDEKPLKPVATGDALPEVQLGAQAGMIVSPPPVPDQPLIPTVPVPLDELLKVAGELSEEGRLPEA